MKDNPLSVIDQLCQGYHWSFNEAMSLTIPQLILLGHASWANDKRMRRSIEREKESTGEQADDYTSDDPYVTVRGKRKRFSEMDSDDWIEYYRF